YRRSLKRGGIPDGGRASRARARRLFRPDRPGRKGMTRAWAIRVAVALAVVGLTVSAASADQGSVNLSARLSGFTETPPNLTNGSGTFRATIHGDSLTYKLSFSNLSSTATQSHIHFAQTGVAGGIVVWLCGSATNPGPAG